MEVVSTRQIWRNVGIMALALAGVTGAVITAANAERKIEKERITTQQQNDSIQEALKTDSIAKANYALGMQAVRDSLKSVKE